MCRAGHKILLAVSLTLKYNFQLWLTGQFMKEKLRHIIINDTVELCYQWINDCVEFAGEWRRPMG